jgi:hypothetical protein
MISLEELIATDIQKVLASSELSAAVINYYSKLYAGGLPVRGCESSRRMYHRRLQIDGLETKKRIDMAKYQLKSTISTIRFKNQIYNSSTITDEIAEGIIKEYPEQINSFIIKEEPKEEKKEVKAPVKRRTKKTN